MLLGTNPLAIGVPSGAGPLILDIATSIVAYGTVKKYAQRGLTMPEGWFVDPQTGAPITDPTARMTACCCRWANIKARASR